jgi:hypothetical protein
MNNVSKNASRPPALLVALALVALCLLSVPPSIAQDYRNDGDVGIGGQIGEPSGLSLKIYHPSRASYDFLAAWDLDDFFFLNVHAVFEHHFQNEESLHFFLGPGGFVGFRDHPRDRDDDVVAGISGTFGLGVLIDRFEIYIRFTPRLSVIPETNGDIGGGLGLRYYF